MGRRTQAMKAAWRLVWAALTDATNLNDTQRWLVEWVRGGLESDSGVVVTEQTSMSLAAVWYAVNRIAGDVGQLPLILYQRTPGEMRDNRERAKSDPAYRLMKTSPSPTMTATVFKETLTANALLRGNGYAYIVRSGVTGRADELIWLDPASTFPFKVYADGKEDWKGELWYKTIVHKLNGGVTSLILRPDEVFHLRGLGWDGLTGYSVISLARQSFGLAIAAEKHGARFFKNNARPGIVLEAPPGVFEDEQQAKTFLKEFNDAHANTDNAHKTGLLREGIQAKPLTVSNEDSQWLESRTFQRVEVALWFGLEYITGDDSSVSYNSLEQKAAAYLQSTLQRWLVRWQEEAQRKLLTERQKQNETHYFEFLTAALLRGALADRYKAYEVGIRNEWLSPNDVREMENLNERPDGGGNDYANPNVKSAAAAGGEPPPLEPPPQDALTVRRLVSARMRRLCDIERQRVANAARHSKAFMAWADSFYQTWAATLGAAVTEAGGDPEIATRDIERSSRELLAAVQAADAGGLAEAVDNVLMGWADKAAKLTDQILRHQKPQLAA